MILKADHGREVLLCSFLLLKLGISMKTFEYGGRGDHGGLAGVFELELRGVLLVPYPDFFVGNLIECVQS